MTATAPPVSTVEALRCASCGTELQGEFCHQCGEKRRDEHELALKHFALHGVHELTHLDSKVFATVRYLFTRPGYLTQEYVAGRRSFYMKPLSLFLVACAVFFLVDSYVPRSAWDVHWVTRQDRTGAVDRAWTKLSAKKHISKEVLIDRIQERMHKLTTVAEFANVLVIAGILALLYRKRYFVEHLVFAFHFLSFTFLLSSMLHTVTYKLDVYSWASYFVAGATALVYLAYLFLALRRVHQQSTGLTLLKCLLTVGVTWLVLIVTQIAALVVAMIAAAKS